VFTRERSQALAIGTRRLTREAFEQTPEAALNFVTGPRMSR
jgi:hypothetical protein